MAFITLWSLNLGLHLDNGGAFGDVDAVQELADIFILDSRGLLNTGSRLRHGLDAVSEQLDLVLLIRYLNLDAIEHGNAADTLLAQIITDL